jgi:hypothetical protein
VVGMVSAVLTVLHHGKVSDLTGRVSSPNKLPHMDTPETAATTYCLLTSASKVIGFGLGSKHHRDALWSSDFVHKSVGHEWQSSTRLLLSLPWR